MPSPTFRRARWAFAVVGVCVGIMPGAAAAQDGCVFGNDGNDDFFRESLPSGVVTYVSNPHFLCDDGVQIWADSAVAYAALGMTYLIGRVRYLDATRELRADEARYFSDQGRLQAQGHMSIRDEQQGSSIENGDLVYLRRTDFRAEETMTVVIGSDLLRPRAVLAAPAAPLDSAAPLDARVPLRAPPEPYTVVGDRIFLRGASAFTSAGDVEIVRDSLRAFADSADFDQGSGDLLLEGSARVEGTGYLLEGRTITMKAQAESNEIHAVREARLTGDDLLLTAAQIFVFLRDNNLERLVAIPGSRGGPGPVTDSTEAARPRAIVQDFVLTADSLEVTSRDNAVQRVFAAGSARSVSTSGDSLNTPSMPAVATTDWLEGDTVVVSFRAPDADSGDLEVDRIVARVRARSLYRLAASDTAARPGTDPPAVHYVVGNEISIEMGEGEVRTMQVVGQTRGVHLEPLRKPAVPDTVVRDTTNVIEPASIPSNDPNRREPTPAHDTPREEEPWIRP